MRHLKLLIPTIDRVSALRQALAALLLLATTLAAHAALPFGNAGDDEFLPVREAFRLSLASDDHAFTARWKIADGYYLYRARFRFVLVDAAGKPLPVLGDGLLPAGEEKDDEIFGRVEVYHREVAIRLPLAQRPPTGQATLKISYQGCAEAGLCYPPETEEWPVDLTGMTPAGKPAGAGAATAPRSAPPATAITATVVASMPAPAAPARAPEPVAAGTPAATDSGAIARFLADASFAAIVGTFLLLGLGLAFTPCVLPMVPILSSIVVGEGHGISTRRAFALSFSYVLGMALTYTVAGVAVGYLGARANVQLWLQSPVVLSVFAMVFVALAMSMFGFYELQVPSFLRDRLSAASGRQQGGKMLSVALMGAISALVVSPCVSAPLAGALVFISTTGNAVLGGTALFALAMGMGAPLLLLGTSGGRLLPKAGAWMNGVKAFFGVLLLGVAIILLARIVPPPVTLALWAALLGISAIYLGALDTLGATATGWHRFRKGAGLLLAVYAATLVVGAAGGGDDPLEPLGFLKGSAIATEAPAAEAGLFTRVKDEADLRARLAEARAAGKAVMLDYYAEWCVACRVMARELFPKPSVRQALADYVVLQVDATDNNDANRELINARRILGLPSILFFRPDGTELEAERVQGELDESQFLAHIRERIEPNLR